MKAIYDTTYLISNEDINTLQSDLKASSAAFKTVEERYKGVNETSLVVLGVTDNAIIQLLKKHNQECALKLDGTRNAELLFTDGTLKFIGQFKAVDHIRVQNCDGYTYDPITNQYFIVESN